MTMVTGMVIVRSLFFGAGFGLVAGKVGQMVYERFGMGEKEVAA